VSSRSEQLGSGADAPNLEAGQGWVVPALLIFVCYFLAAALSSQWSLVNHEAPAIWPAAGIAVAGLAIAGLRYWPVVALAMFAAFSVTTNSHPLAFQLLLAASKALAAVAGAAVLRKSAAGIPDLRQLRDLGMLLAAGCAAALVSAVSGTALFWAEAQRTAVELPSLFVTWSLGDVLGVLVFGALIISWQRIGGAKWRRGEWTNFVATLAVTAVVAWLVYFGPPRSAAFYLYPVLVWAAFYLRTAGATAALAVLSIIAVAGTSAGLGPFADESGHIDVVRMQQYLAIATLMTLLVAVVSEERMTQAETETQRAESLAERRLAELTSLYESAPIGLAFFDRNYRYMRINDELAEINGVPAQDHIGRTIREVLSANAPYVEPAIDRVFETGQAARNLEVSGETPQQPGVHRHWLTGLYPVKDRDGNVEAVGIWVIEISDRKRSEERETLLAREVDHRAKNLLAVVQSVVQLTRASEPAELKAAIVGRIQALARAHSLLAESRWDGAQLGDLVREELAPYFGASEGQVTVEGPPIFLRPAAAQSLAIVLHELATNAAKYGALSSGAGRLRVSWTPIDGDVELVWDESGSAKVTAPKSSGFGSKIIEASVKRQLHGKLSQEWRREGLLCKIRIAALEASGSGSR
jgi:PAS domain S-box-containing protein